MTSTHYDLAMPYGARDRVNIGSGAWWHQAIIWTNVDFSSLMSVDI